MDKERTLELDMEMEIHMEVISFKYCLSIQADDMFGLQQVYELRINDRKTVFKFS